MYKFAVIVSHLLIDIFGWLAGRGMVGIFNASLNLLIDAALKT